MVFFEEHGGGVIVQGLHPGSKVSSSGLKHAFSKKARIVLPFLFLFWCLRVIYGHWEFRVPNRPVSTYIPRPTFGAGFATGPQARTYGRCIVLLNYTSVAGS